MRSWAWASCGALCIACTSTPNTDDDAGAASVDAASGPQPVGAPCDPALAAPCLSSGDPCLGVACDPTARVCTEYVADGGPTCSGGSVACTSSADCDLGLSCGFAIGAGCATAGTCINPPLLCQDDAAACGSGGLTCSCSGVDVPILVPGYASAPSPSGDDCAFDGGDGGGDADGAR